MTDEVWQVNKHELVAHLGIPFRDLRILDPSVGLPISVVCVGACTLPVLGRSSSKTLHSSWIVWQSD